MNAANMNSILRSKKSMIIFALFVISQTVTAQSNHDLMVSGNFDLIKTDYSRFFDKAQLGLEAHYFVIRHFAASAGVEIWTEQKSSFAMGMRWYPQDHFFVRFRGLIGQNDATIGAGWTKPINNLLRFEAMGDFYFSKTEFAIRAGISYVIKTKASP